MFNGTKILVVAVVLSLFSCTQNHGYIYDLKTKKPLKSVIVKDIDQPTNLVVTDSNGKFSFLHFGNLIITKEGYLIDTLEKFGCKPGGKCFNGHIFYMSKKSISDVSR